ncbi:MAG: class I tRNA ligase family protein, partial [Nitrospirae bacterium]|nr:class I tRNA ligase family protein [Nitrospirota bacterium]
QGKKMSKSLGNVIAPQEVIKANGADIVRLWVSAEDYRDDVRLSKEIISRLTEAYRKIRNTGRFLLGNISDFDGKDYSANLLEIDRWAMSRLQGLIRKVTEAYEDFNFHEAFHSIYNFCIVDMSSFYLDILKDRLYTFREDSVERRAAQWVMYRILVDMTRLMAPVLSFTAEEIWNYIPRGQVYDPWVTTHRGSRVKGQVIEESVFLSSFPIVREEFLDEELEKKWGRLIKVRDEANKALEIKRKDKFIGNALEAKLVFYLPDEEFNLFQAYKDFLPALFIVSEVEINPFSLKTEDAYASEEVKNLYIKVERASGGKCERCWNWKVSVGKFEDHPHVCERCHNVI